MALTITRVADSVFGDKRVAISTVLFDSSYPTGGEAVTAAELRLSTVDALFFDQASGYQVRYDKANAKLMVYTPTAAHTHTENTAGAYAQNATTAASTAAAGSQVANTTDLSSLTVMVIAIGN